MTHGGVTSLHGTEKESAKDMQKYERNFVTGLRTCYVMNECPLNMHVIDRTADVPRMTFGVAVFQGRSFVISYSRHSACHIHSLLFI